MNNLQKGVVIVQETPKAQTAFEGYYAMGAERSLPKLAELYHNSTEPIPTEHIATLKKWSTEHDWQQRIIDRVREDAEEVRTRLQERAVKFREQIAEAIEVDVARLLQRLSDSEGELLTETAADLERLAKLYFQLTGQPLTEKVEHGGSMGVRTVPLPIFGETDPIAQLLPDAEARELLAKLAERRAALYEAARSGETPDALNPAAEDD